MNNSKKIAQAAIAGLVSLGVVGLAQGNVTQSGTFVKCYGVAAAAKNDCGTVISACTASIKTAGECYAWIYLPKGVCLKIMNSSINRPAPDCMGPDGKPA